MPKGTERGRALEPASQHQACSAYVPMKVRKESLPHTLEAKADAPTSEPRLAHTDRHRESEQQEE